MIPSTIIDEFLEQFPEHRANKEKIQVLIETIIKHYPAGQTLDMQAKQQIRAQISSQLTITQVSTSPSLSTASQSSQRHRYIMPYMTGVVTAVAIGAFVVYIPSLLNTQDIEINPMDNVARFDETAIPEQMGMEQTVITTSNMMMDESFDAPVEKRAMGGGADSMMYIPDMPQISYTREGALPTRQQELDVYAIGKKGFSIDNATLTKLADQIGILPSVMQNASIQYLTLALENNYVLSLNHDSAERTIYYSNPDENNVAIREAYAEPKQTTVTLDSLLPAIQKFMNQYNIKSDGFGAPVLIDQFNKVATTSAQYSDYGYDIFATVVFPYLIDDKTVSYPYGSLYGITISFDVTNKRVTSINVPATDTIKSMTYTSPVTEANIDTYMQSLGQTYNQDSTETVDVPVEFTVENYVIHYHTPDQEPKSWKAGQYIVPHIMGTVQRDKSGLTTEQTQYMQQTISIPLHKVPQANTFDGAMPFAR